MGALAQHRMGQGPGESAPMRKNSEPFIMHRRAMIDSVAWRKLPPLARQLLDAIERELMNHAGRDNGQLIVTYDNFARYCGVKNTRALALAVRQSEALGFLRVIRGSAGSRRAPNKYELTYMAHINGGPASDEWRDIQSEKDARERLASVKRRRPQTEWFKTRNVVDFPLKSRKTPTLPNPPR